MKPSLQKLATLLSGSADGEPIVVEGGFLWMARPDIAPKAYRHRVYDGLEEGKLQEVVQRYGRRANAAALAWLASANGARLFDGTVVLKGFVSSDVRDSKSALGQPISLDFGNIIGIPKFISADQFVAGTVILGDDLLPIVLDEQGRVSVFHDEREVNSWPSIYDFLSGASEWISNYVAGGSLH